MYYKIKAQQAKKYSILLGLLSLPVLEAFKKISFHKGLLVFSSHFPFHYEEQCLFGERDERMIIPGRTLIHPISQYLVQYNVCKEEGRGEKIRIAYVYNMCG